MAYILTKDAIKEALLSVGAGELGSLRTCVDPSERETRTLFWRDDMENYTTMKWVPHWTGNILDYVNTVRAFEGDYVLRFRMPTARHAGARTLFGRINKGKIAFEVRWLMDRRLIESLVVSIINGPITGDAYQYAGVSYDTIENRWLYRGAALALLPISGGEEYIGGNTAGTLSWNYLKLIVDFENNFYEKLITNSLNIDLKTLDYTIPTDIADWTRGLTFFLLVGHVLANGDPVYFDDARIYVNEV